MAEAPSAKRPRVSPPREFTDPEDALVTLDDAAVQEVRQVVADRQARSLTTQQGHVVRIINDPYMCCVFTGLFDSEFLLKAKVRMASFTKGGGGGGGGGGRRIMLSCCVLGGAAVGEVCEEVERSVRVRAVKGSQLLRGMSRDLGGCF